MEWRDTGTVLATRKHGETSAIVEVFTAEHGRHTGVVRGGVSRKIKAVLQPGSHVSVAWRARLEDHLGAFTIEPVKSRAALMGDRLQLGALNAVTAMLVQTLPERESHPYLYADSEALFDRIGQGDDWPMAYLHWELALLEELGYGLDLSRCAVTGSREDLAYVSPRTGRAVGRAAAGEWADRLLPLPHCLLGQSPYFASEVTQGLTMTGHFLEKLMNDLGDRPLPPARQRFLDLLSR
ncbi:DNA repair protein RecO [Aliiroseovarius sp. PTFE2010]|uniref:DNA repair protein RecO n=1 Tax=Aliiroseovarius sp. PTFE2010 TaxID=3417190 RepID=UPI003CE7F1AF